MHRSWHHFVPRPGQEVLVAFQNGNIDRPVVIGSLYNGEGNPDAAGNRLAGRSDPAHSHRASLSGIKTQELAASRNGQGHAHAHAHAHMPCPLPTAHCPLPTAHCPLPTAHCPECPECPEGQVLPFALPLFSLDLASDRGKNSRSSNRFETSLIPLSSVAKGKT